MKKAIVLMVALVMLAFPATVYAGDGITNNPNSFELNMNCGGEMVHVTIPSGSGNSSGGRTDDMIIGHPRTHKIDFEQDGIWDLEFVLTPGQGFETIFCTWTWDYDPYLHGMDIQFVR